MFLDIRCTLNVKLHFILLKYLILLFRLSGGTFGSSESEVSSPVVGFVFAGLVVTVCIVCAIVSKAVSVALGQVQCSKNEVHTLKGYLMTEKC